MEPRQEQFSVSAYHDRESVGRVLRALADGFAEGRIELTAGAQGLALTPDGPLRVQVKAGRRGRGSRLALRVSWRTSEPEPPPGPPLEVRGGTA